MASPYPVILSLENHCSLPQQVKMAQMFVQIFGEKLVTRFQFETDFSDEPQLPSPNQLRYRILIKNKKLRAPIAPALNMKMRANTLSKSVTGRTNSLISTASTGSLNEEEDDEYEDEEDEDEGIEDSLPQMHKQLKQPALNQLIQIYRLSTKYLPLRPSPLRVRSATVLMEGTVSLNLHLRHTE